MIPILKTMGVCGKIQRSYTGNNQSIFRTYDRRSDIPGSKETAALNSGGYSISQSEAYD